MSPGPVTQPIAAVNPPPVDRVDRRFRVAHRSRDRRDAHRDSQGQPRRPLAQLKYEWKADVGTFTGEGASVRWRAPKGATTPADQTIRLTVTETYGDSGISRTSSTAPARSSGCTIRRRSSGTCRWRSLATSPTRRSRRRPASGTSAIVAGKGDEKGDIESNREHFVITGLVASADERQGPRQRHNADMSVACSFTSRIIKCEPGDVGCVVGSVGTVRWRLPAHRRVRAAAVVAVRQPLQRRYRLPGFKSFFSAQSVSRPIDGVLGTRGR